jgi:hypothetical protein
MDCCTNRLLCVWWGVLAEGVRGNLVCTCQYVLAGHGTMVPVFSSLSMQCGCVRRLASLRCCGVNATQGWWYAYPYGSAPLETAICGTADCHLRSRSLYVLWDGKHISPRTEEWW